MLTAFPRQDELLAMCGSFRRKEQAELARTGQPGLPASTYFMRQTVGNACGTVAVLHTLLNNADRVVAPGTPLADILAATRSLNPDERAKYLEDGETVASIHSQVAQQGQTAAPDANEDVDLHFVAFVNVDGHIVELDGRKPFAIDHGAVDAENPALLPNVARVVRKFMERDPGNMQFTLMALAAADF
ncbi:ubiquitinyl hydrolase 1 [Blastocladiella emersonii ATCC 22665]|nr:ubiquitinyl hydrolase 1 [Blastocladiella emersonii ATCC 22665]